METVFESVQACLTNFDCVIGLQAHFISSLPEVQPLLNTLVYLDLSFNNFEASKLVFVPYLSPVSCPLSFIINVCHDHHNLFVYLADL